MLPSQRAIVHYTVSTPIYSFMYVTTTKVSSLRIEPTSYLSLPIFPFTLSQKLFLLGLLNDWYEKIFISKSQVSKSYRVTLATAKEQ